MTVDAGPDRDERERLNAADAAAWMQCARAGDLEAAWRLSDRIRSRGQRRDHTAPRHVQQIWDGTPLDGRRVLVRCYHGLGDTLQFIRYAPLVKAVAREVVVWAQPALLDLLATAPGIDRLLPLRDGTVDAPYDVDVEIMELPYVFRSTLATLPRTVPYLHAPAAPLTGPSPRVGLVWRAGDWDARRSLPFEAVRRLLDLTPAVSWHALQHGTDADQMDPRLRRVPCAPVSAAARAMRGLDLVVTVDSLPAHLAGALGVPVWTLLPTPADWRWLDGRADSPWYPTMRLFRQPRDGEWNPVLTEVAAALQRR